MPSQKYGWSVKTNFGWQYKQDNDFWILNVKCEEPRSRQVLN